MAGRFESGRARRVSASTLQVISSLLGAWSCGQSASAGRRSNSCPRGVAGWGRYGPMPIMSMSMPRNSSMSSAMLACVWPGMPTMMPVPAS